MENENKVLAGSEPINPMVADTPMEAKEEVKSDTPDPEQGTPEEKAPDPVALLEARLKESQSMIGKQGNTMGALKSEIAALRAEIAEARKQPEGPGDEQVLADLYKKMDTGEIDIATGMQQALQINSKLTAAQVMRQFQADQQRNKTAEVQGNFLKENPDFHEVVNSGTLQSYLDADPLSDEYTAYKMYKADQKIAELEKATQAKIAAAKEEGAKLAKGAEAAGKVLGKQGATPTPQSRPQGPWKNSNDATEAMLAKLREIRSASST